MSHLECQFNAQAALLRALSTLDGTFATKSSYKTQIYGRIDITRVLPTDVL